MTLPYSHNPVSGYVVLIIWHSARDYSKFVLSLEEELKEVTEQAITGEGVLDNLGLSSLQHAVVIHSMPGFRTKLKHRIKCLQRAADIRETLLSLRNLQDKKVSVVFTESKSMDAAMSEGSVDGSNVEKQGNIVDVVGDVVDEEKSGLSSNTQQGQENKLTLNDFFERPIPISTFQVPLSTDLSVSLSIWNLFTLDPAVRAKLRNYAFLRGNMHIRIAVSGTPFHYGRLLVSYQPVPDRNDVLVSYLTNLGFQPVGTRPLFLNYLSQSPGAVIMDVKDNQPVDIVCPFISSKPMHRLFNDTNTAIGASSSYPDLAEAGDLYIYSLNNIKSVSATPSEVSVYVYGWMTDVQLGAPTATQVGITTESRRIKPKKKVDEREVGPVENVATWAVSVSDALSSVPVIEPFAKASSMVFSGVKTLAAIFGWSKPIMIKEPSLVKNMPYQNGAHVIGYDTNYRITLDPKQELTVDPRVLGDGTDEMMISHICSIESYFTTFTWADTTSPLGAPIFTCGVCPNYKTSGNFTTTSGARRVVQPTALAFAAGPFGFWRGTIKYRIDIVASAFHRGKLAIFYEPNVAQEVLINTSLSTNKQFMRIVDIQETQSIEFCVEWAYPRAWATLEAWPNDTYTPYSLSGTYIGSLNGYWSITPLTSLQSPDDSDVSINVFVSSEDMEFNFLNESHMPYERVVLTESKHMDMSTKDVTCFTLNESSATKQGLCEEHFGERPISFRSLLKRYSLTSSTPVADDASTVKVLTGQLPIMPRISPLYSTTPSSDTSNTATNLFSYLRYAYVGIRGGIRKRIQLYGVVSSTASNLVKVSLDGITAYTIPSGYIETVAPSAILNGTVSFVPNSNGGIEFELPFYTNNLYGFSFAADMVGSNTSNDMESSWVRNYFVQYVSTGSTSDVVIEEESASAEDFSLMRFQGAPYHSHT